MAGVSLSSLHDASISVEERLKLACTIARNGSPHLRRRKVAFLVKWACQELCNVYGKKRRQEVTDIEYTRSEKIPHISRNLPPIAVCSQLWAYLATMLESEGLIRERESGSVQEPECQRGAHISVHLIQVRILNNMSMF